MFQEILESQKKFIIFQKLYRNYDTEVKEIVDTLNKNKIITLSGMRHSGKTKCIHALLQKTNQFDTTFYFNKEKDSLGIIKNKQDFITLFDLYVKLYGLPKIVIIQHGNQIEGIKELILQLYKTQKYKIIIVGNNIKIEGVPDIEIFPLGIENVSLEESIYGGIPEVRIVPDIGYKSFLLQALKHEIIARELLEAYSIKNIALFYQVISFISKLKTYHSQREIHRMLGEHGIEISLLTLIEYINAALTTKLLHRVYLYDIKQKDFISSQAQYFFGDVGIRFAFSNTSDFYENILFLECKKRKYQIFGGINGRFQFSFFIEKGDRKLHIHFSEIQEKEELRKLARKLAKIQEISEKYIIVPESNIAGMRKLKENGVEIIALKDFIQKI